LVQIVQADSPLRPGLGPAQDRQSQRGQNGNDGHHHQQLNQGESPGGFPVLLLRLRPGGATVLGRPV